MSVLAQLRVAESHVVTVLGQSIFDTQKPKPHLLTLYCADHGGWKSDAEGHRGPNTGHAREHDMCGLQQQRTAVGQRDLWHPHVLGTLAAPASRFSLAHARMPQLSPDIIKPKSWPGSYQKGT